MKDTGPSYSQKFVSSDNPSQNIWNKLKKYSKIRHDFENVTSNFECFFDSYCERLISGRKTGH